MARIHDPGTEPERVRLLAAFINADDWREKRRLAEQDADLASEQAARLLDGWVDAVEEQGDVASADELRRYADFLTLVRAEGVATAFEAAAESAARDADAALRRFHDSPVPAEASAVLDDAITSYTTALAATTRPRHVWWSSLGLAYSERYELTADQEDLDLSVELARRALQDTAPDDAARAGCLVNLATYLLDRHDAGGGEGADLAAAADAARQAVDIARHATGPGAEYLSAAWLARARAAQARFDADADPAGLEDAVAAARAALQAAATDRDRATGAGILGTALLSRYAVAADPDDIEAAVAQHGRALELTTTPSARPVRLSNLGIALLARYDLSGDIGDVDEAIDVLEQASALVAKTASSAGAVLTNLGLVLAERYERRRARADLDAAVAAFRRAVELTPARPVSRPWMLLNLGGGLIDLYEEDGRRADLDAAVDRLTEGLALLPPGSADTAGFHNRLNVALRHRADRAGPADLDGAVDAARLAVEVTAPDSPLMPGWLDGLATALRARWAVGGAEQDRREASAASRRATTQGIGTDPATALRAALSWQSWALRGGDADEAAAATGLAVTALRALVSTQLLRADKETWLRDAVGLAGRAALAFTSAGDGPGAVLAVERCRAVLLDEALHSAEAAVGRLEHDGRHDLALRLRLALGRTGRVGDGGRGGAKMG